MSITSTSPPFFTTGDDIRTAKAWLTTGKAKLLQSLTKKRQHTMPEYGPGLFSWAALEPFAKDIDWHARIVEAMTQDGH